MSRYYFIPLITTIKVFLFPRYDFLSRYNDFFILPLSSAEHNQHFGCLKMYKDNLKNYKYLLSNFSPIASL